VHRIRRGVSNGRWKYLVRSLENLLIVQCALVCAKYPRYPPTLNLKSSPSTITNQPYPHQPNPALPKGQGKEKNREQHCERKSQNRQCLTFFKKGKQSLSRLIVPRTEGKPENHLKVSR